MKKTIKKLKPLKILFMRSGGYFMDIEPPDAPMIGPPRSILYLAGIFKNDKTVKTKFIDVLANYDFKHVKSNKKNPPIYFGMSDNDILKSIKKYNPQVIAITSTANYFINDTIHLINIIHKNFPSVFIAVGGPDATNDYQIYFDKTSGINVIVMKEGEVTFKKLIDALKNNKPWKKLNGIAYKENEKIVLTKDQPYIKQLDEYQCDYNIVDLEKYFKINKQGFPSRLIFSYPESNRSIDLVTSRGCHHKCSFCCIHLHMGKKFRSHSVEYVLSEMQYLIKKHNVRNFHFEDDNLLHDLERFKNILRGIIKNNWNITWDTPNGIRADLVDEEFLQLCKKSGCTYLMFGIESGSKKVLDKIVKKDISLEDIINTCRLCYEYEIDTLAFYIFGMPGETKEDLLKTYYFAFDLFKKYNTTPLFQLWRPYRNTDIEKNVRNTTNITQQVIYSIHKEFKIPYTLFYSKVYEDQEITLKFLSYYFEKYTKDAAKFAFINWLKIARKKPLLLIGSLFRIFFIFIRASFAPSSAMSKLRQYVVSPGILPFAHLNRLGTKKRKIKR